MFFVMLLIWKRVTNIVDPWGTLLACGRHFNSEWSTLTWNVLVFKEIIYKIKRLVWTDDFSVIVMSYALIISKPNIQRYWFRRIYVVFLYVFWRDNFMYLYFFGNRHCSSVKQLKFSKNPRSLRFTIFSSNLHRVFKSEIE